MKNKEKYNKNFLKVEYESQHDLLNDQTTLRFKIRELYTNSVIYAKLFTVDTYNIGAMTFDVNDFLDEWLEREYEEPVKSVASL